MKISLMKKLSLGFLFAVIGSIILASIISNYTVGKEFKNYLVDEHKAKVDSAVKLVNELYSKDPDLLAVNTAEIQRYAHAAEIQRYALMEELYIEVKDLKDNILYSSGNSHLKHNMMMGNMMGGMHSFADMKVGEYTEEEYPLLQNNKNAGAIIIGYFGTSYLSEASVTFMSTLNKAFIISAGAALIFGLIISIITSRQLSKPLVKITDTANKMRTGNLEVRLNINTTTKEIEELSNSINYLAETLSYQENLRRRLTSDMAHELRTPLTVLKTHIEAFLDGVWEPSQDKLKEIDNEIERLKKMVENLRGVARLEEGSLKLHKEKINLSQELEGIIQSFRPLYLKGGFSIASSIEPSIEALVDRDKLRQIIHNLLSNSLRYLKTGGYGEVILKKTGKSIIIKVKDNGTGISNKDLPHIFERFYRSDLSRSKDTGGQGIGLSITKALVEAHGGKIAVESSVGEGTTFTISIPGGI